MKISKYKLTNWLLIFIISVEIFVRAVGLTDFPLINADNNIGYIPKPSQSGSFLRIHHWSFNKLSMQNDGEFFSMDEGATLLIGDSIVAGGNPFNKEERVGEKLSMILKQPVWSISAGSWGIINEITYLKLHPEVVKGVSTIIFITNSGDFGKQSTWSCEYTHPRTYPFFASLYLFRRYIYNWDWESCKKTPAELSINNDNWKEAVTSEFSKNIYKDKKIIFYLYPDITELKNNNFINLESYGLEIIKLSKAQVSVYSLGRDYRWKSMLYRDDIHPSKFGNSVLSDIIINPNKNSYIN